MSLRNSEQLTLTHDRLGVYQGVLSSLRVGDHRIVTALRESGDEITALVQGIEWDSSEGYTFDAVAAEEEAAKRLQAQILGARDAITTATHGQLPEEAASLRDALFELEQRLATRVRVLLEDILPKVDVQ